MDEVRLKPGWLAKDIATAVARTTPKGMKMALADYVLCETCQKKLVYDGYGTIRDAFETLEIGPVYCVEHRRSPPPAVEGGWRDIATAPKDGTRFLTFDDYYGVRMGRAFIRADHDDWLSYVDCNGNSSKGGIRATHWQPLPEPPK